ncbi:MAG: ion transporter, partial [Gammaproteobacteria bacterium]|nr:ion transporter [Gammaproteobacteria bacterium]
ELSPFAWIYFVSFVVIGTFVVINLFIAVVINNLDEAKVERLKEMQPAPAREDLLEELRKTQQALSSLENKIRNFPEK